MLKKNCFITFTYRSYERIRTEVRTLQVYGHYPCDARIYKSSDRHSGIAETV